MSKPALSMCGCRSSHWPWKASAPPIPTGPTMSGPLPDAELGGERVASALVDEPFELEVDALVRGVEVLGHLELHFDLLGCVTRPEAAVPADHDVARVGL